MRRGILFLKNSLILLFFLIAVQLRGQVIDADTTRTIQKESQLEIIHSPKKATIYSAILPGLGQAYNKKYWKIPIVYIGLGTIGYFIDWNNNYYQFNRRAYKSLTDTLPETNMHVELALQYNYDLTNPTDVRNFKDALSKRQEYFRRNRDLLIISMFGFYALNIIDASVDAHLFNFDISDDLTFKWNPSMKMINNQHLYCINCIFNF